MRAQASFEYLLLGGGVIILALIVVGSIVGIGRVSEAFSRTYSTLVGRLIP